MALAMHFQLNPQARPFVPTAMAPALAYYHRKWEEEEEPATNHQIRSGDGRGNAGKNMERSVIEKVKKNKK